MSSDIVIFVGLPPTGLVFEHKLPDIIIEPDPERLDELRGESDLAAQLNAPELFCAIPGPGPEDRAAWRIFNDSRLNGPWEKDHWQKIYPNAQELKVLHAKQVTIGQLLEDYLAKRNISSIREGEIVIFQGRPQALLEGCGKMLRSISRITFSGPTFNPENQATLDQWLEGKGFVPAQDLPNHWQRDPVQTLSQDLAEAHRQVAHLEETVAQGAGELLKARSENEKLREEVHIAQALSHELRIVEHQLTNSNNQLAQENQKLTAENQTLHQDLDEARSKQDQLSSHLAELSQEKDGISLRLTEMQSRVESTLSEKQHLANLVEEKNARQEELDSEIENLKDLLNKVTIHRDELAASQQELIQRRDELTHQNTQFSHENDGIRLRLAEMQSRVESILSENQHLANLVDEKNDRQEELNSEIENLKDLLNKVTIHRDELAASQQELIQRRDELNQQNTQCQTELNAARQIQEDLDQKLSSLLLSEDQRKEETHRLTLEVEKLKGRLGSLKKEIEVLGKDKQNAVARNEKLIKENQDLTQDITALRQQHVSTQQEMERLRGIEGEFQSLRTQFIEKEKSFHHQQQQINGQLEQLRRKHAEVVSQRDKALQECQQHISHAEKKDVNNRELLQKVEQLHQARETLMNEKQEFRKRVQELEQTELRLNQQLSAMESLKQAESEKIASLVAENNNLRVSLDECNQNAKHLAEKQDELQANNSQLNERLEALAEHAQRSESQLAYIKDLFVHITSQSPEEHGKAQRVSS